MAKFWFRGIRDGEAVAACSSMRYRGVGSSSPRKIRVSDIAYGAMCEAKMQCAEVVALWYVCIIKVFVAC